MHVDCRDRLPNCAKYGHDGCVGNYKAWAEYNCRKYCGFCGPQQPGTDFRSHTTLIYSLCLYITIEAIARFAITLGLCSHHSRRNGEGRRTHPPLMIFPPLYCQCPPLLRKLFLRACSDRHSFAVFGFTLFLFLSFCCCFVVVFCLYFIRNSPLLTLIRKYIQ